MYSSAKFGRPQTSYPLAPPLCTKSLHSWPFQRTFFCFLLCCCSACCLFCLFWLKLYLFKKRIYMLQDIYNVKLRIWTKALSLWIPSPPFVCLFVFDMYTMAVMQRLARRSPTCEMYILLAAVVMSFLVGVSHMMSWVGSGFEMHHFLSIFLLTFLRQGNSSVNCLFVMGRILSFKCWNLLRGEEKIKWKSGLTWKCTRPFFTSKYFTDQTHFVIEDQLKYTNLYWLFFIFFRTL